MQIKNKKLFLIYLVFGLLAAGELGWQIYDKKMNADKPAEIATIEPEKLQTFMQQKADFLLVDVRTEAEYRDGHIPGAVLIDNAEISAEHGHAGLPADKEKPIVLYCRSGNRSQQAAQKLVKLGYRYVFDMGGINRWRYALEK